MGSGSSDYVDRIRRLEDLLSDTTCSQQVWEAWLAGLDERGRQLVGEHVKLLLELLKGKHITQQTVAKTLLVCESAIVAWREGKISLQKLMQLRQFARMKGISVSEFPDLPIDHASVVSGVMAAMRALRKFGGEKTRTPLTADVYNKVRSAVLVAEWWEARLLLTEDEVAKAFRKLANIGLAFNLKGDREAVTEWAAAFVVCVSFIYKSKEA